MPVNGFNVGVDYTISYYDGTSGSLITIADVQDVRIVALKHDVKSMPYNQPPRYGYVPDGYKIDFTIIRTSSILEDLAVLNESNFNSGVVQSPGYLNETITNPDGSISKYQYTNFVVYLTDHGNVQRDTTVKLALEGMASGKKKIA